MVDKILARDSGRMASYSSFLYMPGSAVMCSRFQLMRWDIHVFLELVQFVRQFIYLFQLFLLPYSVQHLSFILDMQRKKSWIIPLLSQPISQDRL